MRQQGQSKSWKWKPIKPHLEKNASEERQNSKDRTLTIFSWKDSHVKKCFFKHFVKNENRYKKAGGRMKKYEMWANIAKDLADELIENGETHVPTSAQCESRMKHMRSTYQKYLDQIIMKIT